MSKTISPVIVAFDGIDGCGKTTACEAIKEKLENLHKEYLFKLPRPIKVEIVHFFGNNLAAIDFKAKLSQGMLSDLEIALGALYNSTHTLHSLVPKIAKDTDVILLDRSRASFFAYQIKGCGLEVFQDAFDYVLHQDRILGYQPQYFYLRSSIERSNELIEARGIGKDYFDDKKKEFKTKLYNAYEEFFLSTSGRYVDFADTHIVDLDCLEHNKLRNLQDFKQDITDIFFNKYLSNICSNIKEQYKLGI